MAKPLMYSIVIILISVLIHTSLCLQYYAVFLGFLCNHLDYSVEFLILTYATFA